MQSKRVYEKLRHLKCLITCDEKANGNCRINLNHVTPFGVLEVRPKRASPSLAGCCRYRIPSPGAWLLQNRHAKLLKSESSSDVVQRTCTSAGAGSRSALRSGKIAPIARTDYRRRVAAGRQ